MRRPQRSTAPAQESVILPRYGLTASASARLRNGNVQRVGQRRGQRRLEIAGG
ncbi:MAG: hypothetical protein OXU61_04115 [Gammaproteobacteria bacterium]|nr:hypothetical protein [Gammaproteobacteria bacterium]